MVQTYFNETTYPKTQRQLRNQFLLASARATKRTFKSPNLCQKIAEYGKGYFQISNVHCVHNITSTERRYYERVIWFLLLIGTTGSCLYVYQQFTNLYYTERLVTFVDDSLTPVYIVPFPSLGICPRNRINWPKLMIAHQLFLPPNATAEAIQTFRRFFGILSDFRFGKFNELQALMDPELNLSLLADVDIKAVMAHVSFTCEELFQQPCFWREKSYNCCELFVLELTEYGFCWVFNSLISEKSREKQRKSRFYPYHNSFIGEGTGLSIFLNLDESKQQPNFTGQNGGYILLKRPEKYAGSSSFIEYNTSTKLLVSPQLSTTDESTRVLDPEERKCFLDASESDHSLYKTLPGLEYGAANCYVRCRQEYVYKKCNCNLSLCFPQYVSDNMTACKAKDYKCLYENWEFFSFQYQVTEHARNYLEIGNSSNMACTCLSDCKTIIYEKILISMPLQSSISTKSDVKQIHLDVHYSSIYMRSYCTSINYTFVELLGSLGGIFGLFLGASLMSGVELFYYFTIGLLTHLYDFGYRFNGLFAACKRKAKLTKWRRQSLLRQRSTHTICANVTCEIPPTNGVVINGDGSKQRKANKQMPTKLSSNRLKIRLWAHQIHLSYHGVITSLSTYLVMVQIYWNELTYPTRQRKLRSQLVRPRTSKPATKKPNLCRDILSYAKGYFDISCLHGFSYVTNPKRRYFERVIWLLILIANTCTGIYVYNEINELYYTKRLVTVVQDSLAPIYIVPFPSIGICPRNRINWLKVLEAHKVFLPPNASAVAIETFRKFFANMGNIRFGKFEKLKPVMEADLDLSLLDDVDVSDVLEYASFTCDEFFQLPCFWREKSYNCCELFSLQRTGSGFCFIFNSLVTDKERERARNDRYYPYRNDKTIEGSGLDVTVTLDESKNAPNFSEPNGVYVMIKQPQVWSGAVRFISYNTYSKLPVIPQSTITADETRAVTPVERKCLFEDETWHPLYKKLPNVEYRRYNCYSRCRQEYVFNNCNCNLDPFFPKYETDNMQVCKAKDYKCLYKFRELFGSEYHIANKEDQYIETTTITNESMICNCLSSCTHLIYDTTYISEALQMLNNSSPIKLVRLDVHYTSPFIRQYSTMMRFAFVELLANFGGIFGLFLGGSLMSIVELIYYFTIGLHTYLHERGYMFNGWFDLPKFKDRVGIWKKRNQKPQIIFSKKSNSPHVFI